MDTLKIIHLILKIEKKDNKKYDTNIGIGWTPNISIIKKENSLLDKLKKWIGNE